MPDREKVIKGLEHELQNRGKCGHYCHDGIETVSCEYDKDGLCIQHWGNDALALLKAQEPRVMTLEEAKTLKQDTVVWYEHTGINPPRPRIVHYADNKGIMFTDSGVWLFDEDNYGSAWRCWTSRPTEEQREATPWN